MPKNAVKVCIRTRPTANFAADHLDIDGDRGTINVHLHGAKTGEDKTANNSKDQYNFKFHNVLHNAGQDTVYDSLARDVVQSTIKGINGTIMAYGQTGAGKTFTMIGDTKAYVYRGIAPRAVSQVFSEIDARPDINYAVYVSYCEIYNDKIFDLLDSEGSDPKNGPDYVIAEDVKGGGGTVVRGLTRTRVETEEDALNELFRGDMQRTTAEHLLNKSSNRSHCIFTVFIDQHSRIGSAENVTKSKLHLVDLAGSERLKKTMEEQEGLDSTLKRESMYINQSLTYLEQCVVALTRGAQGHIPYRQTKLTHIIKDSLGGNCNTLFVACCWAEARHLEETVSTLKLASRMMRVQNEAQTNVVIDPTAMVLKLQKEVKFLKHELAMRDALQERSGVTYDEYTPEQRHELGKSVRAYIDAKEDAEGDVLVVQNLRHCQEIFKQFKVIVKNVESDTEARLRSQFSFGAKGEASGARATDGGAPAGEATDAGEGGGEGAGDGGVGDLEDGGGYAVGEAPPGARPATGVDLGRSTEELGGINSPKAASPLSGTRPVDADKAPIDRKEAFELFKTGEGEIIAGALAESKAELRRSRAQAKEKTSAVNAAKDKIDDLKEALDAKEREKGGVEDTVDGEVIVDSETYQLMQELSAAKKSYRARFDELRETRADIDRLSREMDSQRAQLLEEFEAWYSTAEGLVADDDDQLDDGEKFDKMEMERVVNDDPDSLAFFQSQKKMRKDARGGNFSRSIKNKRAGKK